MAWEQQELRFEIESMFRRLSSVPPLHRDGYHLVYVPTFNRKACACGAQIVLQAKRCKPCAKVAWRDYMRERQRAKAVCKIAS